MRTHWKIMTAALWAAFAALTVTTAATAAHAAEITFSSQRDFTEISLNIKDTYHTNPDAIELDVTLSQDAQQRLQAATSAALEQDLHILIDGQTVSTNRVHSVLDTPQMRVIMSRQVALDLMPNLLAGNGGAKPSGTPPVMSPPMAPADSNPEPLFAMPALDAQPQQVMAMSPSMSDLDSNSNSNSALASAASVPALPPMLDAASVADPAPTALARVPRWAIGAWLPTSATASLYAEIYGGDSVAISAHAINALTCNQAKTTVLESSPQLVRLQIDSDASCVINRVAVGQIRISPSASSDKVVIALYAQDGDMNGAPAKEGSYQRKP